MVTRKIESMTPFTLGAPARPRTARMCAVYAWRVRHALRRENSITVSVTASAPRR